MVLKIIEHVPYASSVDLDSEKILTETMKVKPHNHEKVVLIVVDIIYVSEQL